MCSEWHQAVDWYDLRSQILHGRRSDIPADDADTALFWVLKYLLEPILYWLSQHENDPIASLKSEIAALPAVPDWEARLGKLWSE